MALRTKEVLQGWMLIKAADKPLLKQCILMVQSFDENYIRSQKTQIEDRIRSYAMVDGKSLEYNGTSEVIKKEIKALKRKLKPFKTVLY